MSDSSTQEPTMEEILASIRRIISEDDAPVAAAPAEAAAAPPPPAPLPEPEIEEDDVLELTEPVAAAPPPAPISTAAPAAPPVFAGASSQTMGDLDISFPPGPGAAAAKAAQPTPAAFPPQVSAPAFASFEPTADDGDEHLLSDPSATRAASYFGALGRHVPMPAEGRTLEHLVAELLRPVLKDWLDQHLPSIVEAKVQAEVERVSRLR